MAKLIITVEEKTEPIENDRSLYAFGVAYDIDLEGSELSLLPPLGPFLAELVTRAIALAQQHNGGHLHKADTCDRSIPLESHIAEMKAKLNEPFPPEL